ncbi:hypothetical protein E6R41_17265 [Citrobacter freundii]|uniref:Uncharacterized protein n=1 Tax=Citrobacter freundii TaxID=546 RepID=A0AAD1U118_CITFR|nr:hypothetical protein [Salmonella enterica subsp. enterica serovar Virchow]KJC04935.1 hypothetical protein TN42_24450 [Citrobacter freundii]NHM13160.1 hypothetical protein [Citrobacter youngae]RBV99285.1 hypothetical protein B9M98_17415 [Escherichia coli]THB07211.1 hypothetical protein E6R41_17265 [Citrobacter freundii]
MTFFLIIAFALIVVGRLLLRRSLNKLHNEYYRRADERGCAERYVSLIRLYNSRDPRALEMAYLEAISSTKTA